MRRSMIWGAALVALGTWQVAAATTAIYVVGCGSRVDNGFTFTLGISTACLWDGSNNPNSGAINAIDPFFDDWVQVERDGSVPTATAGLLTTDASFSQLPSGRHWYLADTFWSNYGSALVAVKAEGNRGVQDWFGFIVQPGSPSGTFSIFGPSGTRLSAMVLFGRGTASSAFAPVRGPAGIPEPGTLALLGLGLAGLYVGRRRRVD